MGTSSLRRRDNGARALAAILRYVQSGIRSTKEVRIYLRRRGLAGEAAAVALTECRARGLLDDTAGARLWSEHWARRGYAWAAIRLKLSAKGFDEQAITAAERIHGTQGQDEARARHAVTVYCERTSRRVGPSLSLGIPRRGIPRPKAEGLARTLASRGFDSDLIERILHDAIGPRG